MKSFDAHLADCRALLSRRAPIRVAALESVGLELAEPVLAAAPFPTFDSSAMDGYAVRVADVPGRLKIVGEVAAGQPPTVGVGLGTAVRIMTGSALPAGTEAVVRVEDTTEVGKEVQVAVTAEAGQFLRHVGDDVSIGDVVLTAGQVVGPAQLAALAAHNVGVVSVFPRPTVAILSTGDELVGYGSTPGPVQLVDSNGPGLAAAAAAAGADVVHVAQVGDDPDAFLAAMDALPDVDLIVTNGGISMGAYDVVKASLSDRGIDFESVAIQPGKPQALGRYQGRVGFLGLPGNPVSALISFELFGRAVLGRERPVAAARLAGAVRRSPIGTRQFLRGHLSNGQVQLVGGAGSHLIVGLAQANCLIVIVEEVEELPSGADVPVVLLGPYG